MDLEEPPYISELNSAIAFLRLKSAIALFSSEMCGGPSKSTSHPKTMTCTHRVTDCTKSSREVACMTFGLGDRLAYRMPLRLV